MSWLIVTLKVKRSPSPKSLFAIGLESCQCQTAEQPFQCKLPVKIFFICWKCIGSFPFCKNHLLKWCLVSFPKYLDVDSPPSLQNHLSPCIFIPSFYFSLCLLSILSGIRACECLDVSNVLQPFLTTFGDLPFHESDSGYHKAAMPILMANLYGMTAELHCSIYTSTRAEEVLCKQPAFHFVTLLIPW